MIKCRMKKLRSHEITEDTLDPKTKDILSQKKASLKETEKYQHNKTKICIANTLYENGDEEKNHKMYCV